jgi:pyruvate dehydrogenase E1 component beta subunit
MAEMRMRDALREALREEMIRDETIFLMGEDIGLYGGSYAVTKGLLEEFGEARVIDTPIAESGIVGAGIGAAMGGLRPMVELMTINFSFLALDQIVNSAAKLYHMSNGQIHVPMVIRMASGGGSQLAATHSHSLEGLYAHFPGLKVVCPSNAADAKGLLKAAIRDPHPVIFLENEILYGRSFEVPDLPDFTIPFGKAKIWRAGTDVTLVSFGIGVGHALDAADKLAREGISAEVIDLRTLRPMDTATVITSVMKTNRCVTVEEGWPVCSIGSHISSVLMQEAFDHLDAPVITCTGKDVPMPYAANLEKLALITPDEIVAAVKKVTYR